MANCIGDAGLASLASVLDSGMMPELESLTWDTDRASGEAQAALEQACDRREISRSSD